MCSSASNCAKILLTTGPNLEFYPPLCSPFCPRRLHLCEFRSSHTALSLSLLQGAPCPEPSPGGRCEGEAPPGLCTLPAAHQGALCLQPAAITAVGRRGGGAGAP